MRCLERVMLMLTVMGGVQVTAAGAQSAALLARARYIGAVAASLEEVSDGLVQGNRLVEMRDRAIDSSYVGMRVLVVSPATHHSLPFRVVLIGGKLFRMAGFAAPEVLPLASALGPFEKRGSDSAFVSDVARLLARGPVGAVRVVPTVSLRTPPGGFTCADAQNTGPMQPEEGSPRQWTAVICEHWPAGRDRISRLDFWFEGDGNLGAWAHASWVRPGSI